MPALHTNFIMLLNSFLVVITKIYISTYINLRVMSLSLNIIIEITFLKFGTRVLHRALIIVPQFIVKYTINTKYNKGI